MSSQASDDPSTESSSSLQELFEFIFQRGKQVFRPGAPASDAPLKFAFKRLEAILRSSREAGAFENLVIEQSLHRGRYAASPWAALMDRRETDSIQRGVYVVYLVCEDMNGVYLCVSQGVSELEGKDRERRATLRERARALAPHFASLRHKGFELDHLIDLRSNKGLPEDYKAATIAHRFYAAGQVPSDAVLYRDLKAALTSYDGFVRAKLGLPPPDPDRPSRVLRLAHLGSEASWAQWQIQGYAGIATGRQVGSLQDYPDKNDFVSAFLQHHLADYHELEVLAEEAAEGLWELRELAPGDQVVAMRGQSEILGAGTVTAAGYTWRGSADPYPHAVGVEWDLTLAKRLQEPPLWTEKEIVTIPTEDWEMVLAEGPDFWPNRDLGTIQAAFSSTLRASRVTFGEAHSAVVRSFVASLATKRLVILTGLSGSGKTQIALRLGQWFGPDAYEVIPVRPDWTGAEALFGYEDALRPVKNHQRAWFVPAALKFMLKAARTPNLPYLLVLDEMNLAHVERYFADFLSGMESGEPVLPNLFPDDEGESPDHQWRLMDGQPERIRVPDNLFVVGTVNVDETTYMFSPKVLDRANTFEFRVETNDLTATPLKSGRSVAGEKTLVSGFLSVAADARWHQYQAHPESEQFSASFRDVHRVLHAGGFEFGHRVFAEALRFVSMLYASGEPSLYEALDLQIMQKVLPRLHGSRRRLEPTLASLGRYCLDLTVDVAGPKEGEVNYDLSKEPDQPPKLGRSFRKIQRMAAALRLNQFASFTE